MKLTIEIHMDNAAFGDTRATTTREVRRILGTIPGKITRKGPSGGSLRDSNGNTCGTWTLS